MTESVIVVHNSPERTSFTRYACLSSDAKNYFNEIFSLFITDCKEGRDLGYQGKQEYLVQPWGHNESISVICDMAYGLTYIQMRSTDKFKASRSWQSFRTGFGDGIDEYWFGNENLHHITKQGTYILDVMVTYLPNIVAHARYFGFRVSYTL